MAARGGIQHRFNICYCLFATNFISHFILITRYDVLETCITAMINIEKVLRSSKEIHLGNKWAEVLLTIIFNKYICQLFLCVILLYNLYSG